MGEKYRLWRARVRKAFRGDHPYLSAERFEINEDGSVTVKGTRGHRNKAASVIRGGPITISGYEPWKGA